MSEQIDFYSYYLELERAEQFSTTKRLNKNVETFDTT